MDKDDWIVREFDEKYFPQIIKGFFTWPTLYTDIVDLLPNESTIIEVGVLEGQSLAFLLTQAIGRDKHFNIFAVDNFCLPKNNTSQTFRQNMSKVGDMFTLIEETSVGASEKFDNCSIDFIFIDASHEYEDVRNDLRVWLPKMKDGGIMAGHDYIPTYPGVVRAVDELWGDRINKKYAYEGCWLVTL